MASHEHEDVKGQLQLRYDWQESASSHIEKLDKVVLKPSDDNKYVILEEYCEHWNMFKELKEVKQVKHKIDVQKLIELIREHGKVEP